MLPVCIKAATLPIVPDLILGIILEFKNNRIYEIVPGSVNLRVVFVVMMVGLTFLPGSGIARTFINIQPMITVGAQYETNFFRTEENEKAVYTYIVQPGIQLGVSTVRSSVDFKYTLEGYYFDDSGDVPDGERPADDLNYFGHYFVLDARSAVTDRLTLKVFDTFYSTRRVTRYDDYTDDTGLRKHYINRFTPGIYYDFKNRFFLALNYRRQDIDYDDTDIDDSVEHRGLLTLFYNPSRTSTIDIDYQHWVFDTNAPIGDYTSDQIFLNYQKRYKYLFFDGGIGYNHRSYSDSVPDDGDKIVYRLAVGAQNPPDFGIRRRYYRANAMGVLSNFYLEYNTNYHDLGDQRYDHRLFLSVGRLFYRKIKLDLSGYYVRSDYDTFFGLTPEGTLAVREDDVFGLTASLRYLIKERWNLLFMAGLVDRSSNLAGFSYDDTFASAELEFFFPLRRDRRRSE